MKVSVIIPVYNTGLFVEECIRSVQHQTIKDLEIIIVDDGSTDSSKNIIHCLMAEDTRIHYYYQENHGAGAARNVGLRYAQGDFISFLDSDDLYYNRDALERMVSACEINHKMICGSYRNELKNGNIVEADLFKNLGEIPAQGCQISFLSHQNDFFYQSYLFNRSFLESHNLRFPNYRRYEDPPFLLQALDKAETFWLIPTTLHCYRKGHQDRAANGKYVVDNLSGIRDNLIIAEAKYPDLFMKLIDRITCMFWDDILNNQSRQLFEVLQEINTIYLRNTSSCNSLPIMNVIRKINT